MPNMYSVNNETELNFCIQILFILQRNMIHSNLEIHVVAHKTQVSIPISK
jgi:hypothetical protein